MSENTQQQVREQYKVVENTAQHVLRAWNDLVLTTTEFSFDATQQSIRHTLDLRGQAERVAQDALATYRSAYQDGLRAWQGYVQSVSDVVNRTVRD